MTWLMPVLRRGWSALKISARADLYFGVVYLIGTYVLRIVYLLVMLMIWRALFAGGAQMEGMTLLQMYAYTVLSRAIGSILDVRTSASSWLHDGSFLSLYQRPMGIFSQLVLQTVGSWYSQLVFFALPVLLVAGLMGLPLMPATPWTLLSFLLCLSLGFAVDFLFACLIILARNLSYQVQVMRDALTALLTGAIIPFAALPWGLGDILQYTPFGALAGAPLSLWVGLTPPFPMIAVQIGWNLVLWPLAVWGFRRSRERMVSYGG